MPTDEKDVKETKEVLVRELDVKLYADCAEFLKKFGINMNHANRVILEKGFSLILETGNIDSIKEDV